MPYATDLRGIMTHIVTAMIETTGTRDLEHVQNELSILEAVTQDEPGCLFFRILHSDETPGQFTLWEEWTDKAALDAHYDYPHTRRVIEAGITQIRTISTHETLPAPQSATAA